VLIQGSQQFFPTYHVVSLLYPPPGNQSWQSYATGATTGTSTTVGQTFGSSVELTASIGGSGGGLSGSAGASWGFTKTNGDSQTVSTTWTDATGYENNDSGNTGFNPTGSNMIDHNWDMFLIWTNPEVIVTGYSGTPSSFTLTNAPIPNFSNSEAVVIRVPAQYMEANASGASTVPVQTLEPIEGGPSGEEYFMPGLASICANQTLYQEQLQYDIANPTKANGQNGGTQYCTLANQCGCTPADFSQILQMDLLLNYNPKTHQPYSTTPTGYAGNTDPRTLDKSGKTTCSEEVIPQNSDCRYVAVCENGACSSPYAPIMQGGSPVDYTQTDANTAQFTTSASYGEDTSITNSAGFFFFNFQIKNTWFWTDTESTTYTSTNFNQMQLNLATSLLTCTEPVSIYEDTLFHTFAFSVPDDWQTVCP
jgi:hypothetical protein